MFHRGAAAAAKREAGEMPARSRRRKHGAPLAKPLGNSPGKGRGGVDV